MLNSTNNIVTHKSQCYHHTAQIVIYHENRKAEKWQPRQ